MENIEHKHHHVLIKNRESIEVTGIKKIESLNASEFILESAIGYITIEGENLEMVNLNTGTGELNIVGLVKAINYHDKLGKTVEKKEKFINKLFK